MARPHKELGERRKRGGFQRWIWIHGVFYSKQFSADTPIAERRAWRERMLDQHGGRPRSSGTLEADVAAYLAKPEVAAMPSAGQRAAHLALWLEALGRDRRRASITRDDVEAVLQTWLRTLAPATVYHRRTALGRLFTVLDGPDGVNPTKGTTRPRHYSPIDRSVPFATIEHILAAMPRERILRHGIRRPALAPLICSVIGHTGIPPAELKKLKPRDLDLQAGIVRMPWRDKGAGTPAHTRELSPAGVSAFRALLAAGWFETFATEAVWRSFKRAARRVVGPGTPISLYWLRHSMGADLYRATGDLATVGRMLGHAPGSPVTARYAMGANTDVNRAALEALTAARQAGLSAGSVPAAVPVPRNRGKQKGLRRVS